MYKALGLLKFLKPKKPMKWLLKLGFFGLLALGQQLFAQDKSSDFQAALIKKKYDKASDISIYTKDKEHTVYRFKLDGEPYLAFFGMNGRWLKTTTKLDWNELPRLIQESYLKENTQSKVKEAHYVHHFLEGWHYQITSAEGNIFKFNEEGKLLN